MSDSDYAMMRGHDTAGYNFAVGEAFFLADTLFWASTRQTGYGPFLYPLAAGEKELVEEVQLLHPGKHVVITNGGKQAIAAALYAFKSVYKHSSAFHSVPFWPSYPTLIKAAGLDMAEDSLRISTLVNNPNGAIADDICDILDCAYAHWVYGWQDEWPEHKVSVWSTAKMFGTAGIRLGWLITDDKKIAEQAELYQEITTSGVSVLTQRYGARMLKYQREHKDIVDASYETARDILIKNGDLFNQVMGPYCSVIQGVPLDGRGMFAWFRVEQDHHERFIAAINKLNIKLIRGESCGMIEKDWYRMSMGHRTNFTQEALEKLNNELS